MTDKSNLEDIVSDFVDEIQDLSESDEAQEKMREYIKQIQNFGVERYSGSNQTLLWLQAEDRDIDTGKCKYFRGYKSWLNKGRQVKSGEDSFKINGPPIKKPVCPECGKSPDYHNDNDDTCNLHEEGDHDEWEVQNFGSKTLSVFEYSQTIPITEAENKSLEDVEADEVWTPDDRGAETTKEQEDTLESLKSMLDEEDIEYDKVERIGDVRGTSHDGKITIAESMSTESKIQVISHELAHEKLHHDDEYLTEQKEVEAETVSFAVCSYFDIETKSAQYIANWDSEDVKTWKRISDIQNVSKEIIEYIEDN